MTASLKLRLQAREGVGRVRERRPVADGAADAARRRVVHGDAEALADVARRRGEHVAVGLVGHLVLVLALGEEREQVVVGERPRRPPSASRRATTSPRSQSISVP